MTDQFVSLTRAFRCAALLWAILSISCTGCFWQKEDPKPPTNPFPLARLGPDTVVLEIKVLVITDRNQEQFEKAWRQLDSQYIPFHVRKLLDENGIQAALAGSQYPAEFRKLEEPDPIDVDALNPYQIQLYEEGFLKPASKTDIHQRIQNQAGQRHEIPLLKPELEQTISWTMKTEDGHRFSGTHDQALPCMAVTTYPNGNGSVSLVLTPELQYGMRKNRITSFQSRAIYKESKESKFFDDLTIHATLRPGETIMVTCNGNESDLGQTLFERVGVRNTEQRILMIRLAQSQHDDLFSDRRLSTSISTVD